MDKITATPAEMAQHLATHTEPTHMGCIYCEALQAFADALRSFFDDGRHSVAIPRANYSEQGN